jgi:hypothetical protein
MWFDKQSLVVRVLLLIPFWGWLTSGLYRIIKGTANGKTNVTTIVVGVLCIVPFIGFVVSIIDLVTELTSGKITVLA